MLGKRRAEIEEAQAVMRADLERERLLIESKLTVLERERREVDGKISSLEDTRRNQSSYAQTLMAQEDDLDVARRRFDDEKRKLDELVNAKLARSMDRALAGERARLDETRARLAAREAELEKRSGKLRASGSQPEGEKLRASGSQPAGEKLRSSSGSQPAGERLRASGSQRADKLRDSEAQVAELVGVGAAAPATPANPTKRRKQPSTRLSDR